MDRKNFNPLFSKSMSQIVDETDKELKLHLDGSIFGLQTRWQSLNRALLKGFLFKRVNLLAGASGVGKSFILSMIHQDFCNPQLNPIQNFVILHFSFEMSGAHETLRKISGELGVSFGEVIGASGKLTPEQYKRAIEYMETLRSAPIYYVETSGNLEQMEATIESFKIRFPEKELVVTQDHTLLTNYYDERSEIELLAKTAIKAIQWRKKYGIMYLLLGQLNDKLEQIERIRFPNLHYPKKTDIHGSKQLYWACDNVLVAHAPEMLDILKYGVAGYDTEKLLALHLLKTRDGEVGLIRLKRMLEQGRIIEWQQS
jgi:replicative DNA helicase